MSQTATIVPTAAIAERWEATTPVTGDYARDCAELAREALSHVGFSRFEETCGVGGGPAGRPRGARTRRGAQADRARGGVGRPKSTRP
ncbi:MAG: hypothetical protein UHI81_03810, partial [Olegusella sp.]|nr:hypothetical protein [Olegusella sp.]